MTQFKKHSSLSSSFTQDNSGVEQWIPDFLKSEDAYAVNSNNEPLKYFRIVLKDGSYYTISYALLPSFIYLGDTLIIRSHGLKIEVKGLNLSLLEHYLSFHQSLIFLRESTTGINTNKDNDVFIKSIKIQGKTLATSLSEEEL